MRKTEHITKKAFKRYHGYHPRYFPLLMGQIVFRNIPAYFNLWMSAGIVTALYEGRESGAIHLLTGITLLGNLLAQTLAAALDRGVQTARQILEDNETAAFQRKTLSLDYDKLEDPQIRLLRRKITENSHTNFYGVERMRWMIEDLMGHLVNLVFSLALLTEMFVLAAAVPFGWQSGFLFAAMAAFLAVSVFFRIHADGKIAQIGSGVHEVMLQENRLRVGYRPSGLDNRIYRQQEKITRLYERMTEIHLKGFSRVETTGFLLGIPMTVALLLSDCCVYLAVAFYCIMGAFPIGCVIKYVGCLDRVLKSIGGIFRCVGNLKDNEQYLKPYLEFFDTPNDMYQGSLSVEKRSDKKFDIVFQNVSFRYAGAEHYALKDISLKLRAGERLAVVGMNGSGKTTFIKLLCRLYDPTDGEILMNDFNIRKYDYRQYLDLFSVVFQDFQLLALPLGNNISTAAAWDSEKTERLLDKVGFGKRYAEMPRGLDTPLYKNFDVDGVNVSGGEAQKIALARALYRDAPFIILDEPTAALDPVAEAEIYTKFNEIVEDRTAIYISHRLSSCRFCDRIAVFDGGRIVQTGTHEELLADTRGKYHELWHAQAQYYA